jgi:hypothetical protein
MAEVVASVKRVTEIVGQIADASQEQSAGIGQVNEAVTQMDQVTQQNAALVEEIAASAEALRERADLLVSTVTVFTVKEDTASAGSSFRASAPMPAPRPARRPAVRQPLAKAPVGRPGGVRGAAPLAPSADESDWSSF